MVRHKKARFDTKMPGSTQKCPLQHASVDIDIINPPPPSCGKWFFFQFHSIIWFLITHGEMKMKLYWYEFKYIRYHNENWNITILFLNKYPIMRTYALFKFDFECETYLNAVRDRRYRNAISKFRLSSHNLEIERGRHCNPKVPVPERLCFRCSCIEDEQHFLVSCKLYEDLRVDLYDKVSKIITDFYEIGDREKFVRLMNSRDNNVLTWLGKFLYTAQRVRGGHHT